MNFNEWTRAVLARTEAALDARLPSAEIEPRRLHDAMRYTTLGGGKRVRPLLVHAAGLLTGASPQALDAAAAAIEMIHVYSLVHDDMPAMDDDSMRRGKPTVHVQYDEATALLVGDALQSQAFIALSEAPVAAARKAALLRELALASGSLGMAGGQAIDLASVGVALDRVSLEKMHRMKTGALLRAAVRMGALCGDDAPESLDAGAAAASIGKTDGDAGGAAVADQVDARTLAAGIERYSAAVGLAFQVVDDILDVTADSATLGKTAGKDEKDNKPTYVSLLGLDEARALARQLQADAHAALAPFGERAERLAQLADLVVERAN
ncbi:polyprenyl synthetase family protein [Pararobbsia silviterrae]|uniref:Polyprenyl synthetase family protein n=1 Tax=Pararobbsia silviterrae TaxID=1792498 RepID=A0A494Y7C4_9BURK|nr:polyprenyl synthetase family protein [Pararobbsia silviterrae]RKP56511.1 polyprenyl synthetase family protein [Pararobbsia silviterrae]